MSGKKKTVLEPSECESCWGGEQAPLPGTLAEK